MFATKTIEVGVYDESGESVLSYEFSVEAQAVGSEYDLETEVMYDPETNPPMWALDAAKDAAKKLKASEFDWSHNEPDPEYHPESAHKSFQEFIDGLKYL